MRRIQFFLALFIFAITFTSCIQEESPDVQVLDDATILSQLFQPELLNNKGVIKEDVLYIELDAAELEKDLAEAFRVQEDILMSEIISLSKESIQNILGTSAEGTVFENGVEVPIGAFELMPASNTTNVDASVVDTRGPCIHWCRCWDAPGGYVCIDIEICY